MLSPKSKPLTLSGRRDVRVGGGLGFSVQDGRVLGLVVKD